MKMFCDSYCTDLILTFTFDTKIYLRKCIFLIYRWEKDIFISRKATSVKEQMYWFIDNTPIGPLQTSVRLPITAMCLIMEGVTNWHCHTCQFVAVQLLKFDIKDVPSCWHSAPAYISRKFSYCATFCKHSGVF